MREGEQRRTFNLVHMGFTQPFLTGPQQKEVGALNEEVKVLIVN